MAHGQSVGAHGFGNIVMVNDGIEGFEVDFAVLVGGACEQQCPVGGLRVCVQVGGQSGNGGHASLCEPLCVLSLDVFDVCQGTHVALASLVGADANALFQTLQGASTSGVFDVVFCVVSRHHIV